VKSEIENAHGHTINAQHVATHIAKRVTQTLTEFNLPSDTPLVVAYSGGVDSSVLFHAAVSLRDQEGGELHAVHVHHGLSDNADAWARHCELQCRLSDVNFHLATVKVAQESRTSLEAQARKARYEALLRVCKDVNGVLLLGQHAEDQLETVLLQLKRGAGPQGLAAMGEATYRDGVLVLRPMLSLEKQDIVQYAKQESIAWVEDESNAQNSFDRNFLRNDIIPQLIARWPKLVKTVGRSAELCAQQSELLNDTAQQHLRRCLVSHNQLNGDALASLSAPWQANVLRAWFANHAELPPSKAQVDEVLKMLSSKPDATPEVLFKWGKVARFQHDLYWVEKQLALPEKYLIIENGKPVQLSWLGITLVVDVENSSDTARNAPTTNSVTPTPADMPVPTSATTPSIRLETNKRALKVKPEAASVTKSLKDWFKVWRVPLWERDGVPVIYVNDKPVALILNKTVEWLQPRKAGIHIKVIGDLIRNM
jgi:tRNA(Ile)-lysidine synthase